MRGVYVEKYSLSEIPGRLVSRNFKIDIKGRNLPFNNEFSSYFKEHFINENGVGWLRSKEYKCNETLTEKVIK